VLRLQARLRLAARDDVLHANGQRGDARLTQVDAGLGARAAHSGACAADSFVTPFRGGEGTEAAHAPAAGDS